MRRLLPGVLLLLLLLLACGVPGEGAPDAGPVDGDVVVPEQTCKNVPPDGGVRAADAFADRVVSFSPGESSGFGADCFPYVVLGPPWGSAGQQSLDVLTLGKKGSIVLAFDDVGLVDGPGTDLLVFENPLSAFPETGEVEVSADGQAWFKWPCDGTNKDAGYPGCAGVRTVQSSPDNGIPATDPERAGGDRFDLATLEGLPDAGFVGRFVRIADTGLNAYSGSNGGFDLDAVAVVNGTPLDGGTP